LVMERGLDAKVVPGKLGLYVAVSQFKGVLRPDGETSRVLRHPSESWDLGR